MQGKFNANIEDLLEKDEYYVIDVLPQRVEAGNGFEWLEEYLLDFSLVL